MTKETFELTKKFLSKYYLHFASTNAERLGYKIDDDIYGLKENHLENFKKHIQSLTLEQVNQAIKTHLQYENLKIVLVTSDAEKLKNDLNYVTYERASTTSLTPFHLAAHLEIMPDARFNPYIGFGGGGLYMVMYQDPESVDSAVPISNDELSVTIHSLQTMLIAKIGAEMRISEFIGVGLEAAYRYCTPTSYKIEIPDVTRSYDLDLSHIAVHFGMTVYY